MKLSKRLRAYFRQIGSRGGRAGRGLAKRRGGPAYYRAVRSGLRGAGLREAETMKPINEDNALKPQVKCRFCGIILTDSTPFTESIQGACCLRCGAKHGTY